MIINKNPEKGQATLELMLIMLVMIACMLGVLFVGGITVSNNARLLDAKFNAEKESRQHDAIPIENPIEFEYWYEDAAKRKFIKYNFIDKITEKNSAVQKKELYLPFGLDYKPYRLEEKNTLQDINFKLNTTEDSKLFNDYYWDERYYRFSFSLKTSTGNALDAAQLIRGQATEKHEYVDTYKTLRGGDPKNYKHVEKSMRNVAHEWLGITVSDSDIRNNPSNRVYMPIIKVDKKIME